jgi:hypothetical protein
MKDKNTAAKLILGSILILSIAIGFGIFLMNNSEETASTTETETTTENAATEEGMTDESNPQEPPIETPAPNVLLDNLGIGFRVPENFSETESPDYYKRYPNPETCEYIVQSADEDLLIAVGNVGDSCVDSSRFSDEGTRAVSTEIGEFELLRLSNQGRSGDRLILETIDVAEDEVSLNFFYKEKFSNDVQPEIQQLLESYGQLE